VPCSIGSDSFETWRRFQDVGRIFLAGAVAQRDGVHQILVPVHDGVPRLFVALPTCFHQACVSPPVLRLRVHRRSLVPGARQ
jgi:hypothetical protein